MVYPCVSVRDSYWTKPIDVSIKREMFKDRQLLRHHAWWVVNGLGKEERSSIPDNERKSTAFLRITTLTANLVLTVMRTSGLFGGISAAMRWRSSSRE